jgi:hypothetical protein
MPDARRYVLLHVCSMHVKKNEGLMEGSWRTKIEYPRENKARATPSRLERIVGFLA